MNEKELKTSTKQRVVIIAIAVLMLGSMIASYAAIILNGGKAGTTGSADSTISDEKIAEYEATYNAKLTEFGEKTKSDFDKFVAYRSEIKAYNEASANSGGIQTKDLKGGSGRMLDENDNDYLAYYVGWCADGSVFDSSFDDGNNPKAFKSILNASQGLIEGWNAGVVGMNLGGIREITIPGELAYGDSTEICGGYNKPLKFIIMTKANEGSLKILANELDEASMKLQYAYYGIDYEAMMNDNE